MGGVPRGRGETMTTEQLNALAMTRLRQLDPKVDRLMRLRERGIDSGCGLGWPLLRALGVDDAGIATTIGWSDRPRPSVQMASR